MEGNLKPSNQMPRRNHPANKKKGISGLLMSNEIKSVHDIFFLIG